VTALHHLATASPYLAAFVVLLVIAAIGVLIWAALPDAKDKASADIERQCQSLRHKADHAVQHRPRVRANTCHATPGHLKAAPPPPDEASFAATIKRIEKIGQQSRDRMANAAKRKACGGGLCRHQADCSDTYCPGRLTASLLGGDRHARH